MLIEMVAFWLNLWTGGARKLRARGRSLLLIVVFVPFVLALSEESMQAFSSLCTLLMIDLVADFAWLLRF